MTKEHFLTKKPLRFFLKATVFLPLLAFTTTQAKSADNLWFILDSSGSMAGKVDGTAKLDIAKKALPELFSKAPKSSKLFLLAYGHRRKDDCKDIDVIAAGTSASKAIFEEKINGLKPLGKTPMATSLQIVGGMIKKVASDDNNSIVLISDGIETCEGDPCAVAETLASANTKIKTHVVGFKIPEKDKKQLECIAKKGGGQYFAANSTEGFAKAVEAAAKKPKKPKPPEFTEVFRDDFDGDELLDHWEIINPNPDRFIVEDGQLLVVGKISAKLNNPDKISQENFFKLNKELPKGDWILSAKMSVKFQTIHELPRIGIIDKPDKHISARIYTHKGTFAWLNLQILKQTVGGSRRKH
jgi:Mg-chelatase subunit ChlD